MYLNQSTNDQMGMNNIVFISTKEYANVASRSYEVNGNMHELQALGNALDFAVNRDAPLDEGTIAKKMPNIIRLSDVPSATTIRNGWGTRRMRFVLEVETVTSEQSWMTSYIQGYTDYEDNSMSGIIDPNMPININSIINTISTNDPMTGMPRTRMHSTFNILVDNEGRTEIDSTIDSAFANKAMIRPVDVFTKIESASLYDNAHWDDNGMVTIDDRRGSLTLKTETSNKENNTSTTYLTKVINALAASVSMAESRYAEVTSIQSAAGIVAEDDLSNVPFIAALSMVTGEFAPTYFTLNQLEMIFPDLHANGKVKYVKSGDQPMLDQMASGIMSTNDSDNLMAPTVTARIATTILETMTSYMNANNISVFDFTFTNTTGSNVGNVHTISNVNSIVRGIDFSQNANNVMRMFEMYTFPTLSNNNVIGMDVVAHIDTFGDSVVSLIIENDGPYVYRFPSFCDSLFSPVVTNMNTRDAFVNDMSRIVSTVN